MDSETICRIDMGFYIGIRLRPPQKSSVGSMLFGLTRILISAEELSYCSCIKWFRHDIGKHVARIHFSQSYALPIHKILDPEVACRNVLDFSQSSAAADGDTRGCIHVDIDWAGNVPIFEHCLLSQRSTGR